MGHILYRKLMKNTKEIPNKSRLCHFFWILRSNSFSNRFLVSFWYAQTMFLSILPIVMVFGMCGGRQNDQKCQNWLFWSFWPPSNMPKTMTIGKMLRRVVRAYHKLTRYRFENEFDLKIQKKWHNLDLFGISFVFFINFLCKRWPIRGGVKWPSNGLKFFSWTFYDISTQKKK